MHTQARVKPVPAHNPQISELLRKALKLRLMGMPGLLLALSLVMLLDIEQWRVGALLILWATVVSLFFYEARSLRTVPNLREYAPRLFSTILAIQLTAMTLTGGLHSFVTPGVPVVCIVMGALTRDFRYAKILPAVIGAHATVLAVLDHHRILVPVTGMSPNPAHPIALMLRVIILIGISGFATAVGVSLARALEGVSDDADRMKSELIDEHKERLQSLEALSSRVAHELKNPLSAIKGLTQLMQRSDPNEHLRVIAAEVERMQQILDGLLSFSRPLEEMRLSPVRLGAIIGDVVQLLEVRLRSASINVEVRDGTGGAAIAADARRIKQVVLNVTLNAIEALEQKAAGPRNLRIDVENAGNIQRLRVHDNGTGIQAPDVESLFTPYVTTKREGSGLGLPISRALARAHGGELGLAPGVDGGAVATLTLPVASSLPEAA